MLRDLVGRRMLVDIFVNSRRVYPHVDAIPTLLAAASKFSLPQRGL